MLQVFAYKCICSAYIVWGNCRRELLLWVHKAKKMCARSIYDVYDYR